MKEIKGNIFDITDADAICVTTNGIVKSNGELVMGAGIAKQFAERYPGLAYSLGQTVLMGGNHVYRKPEFLPNTPADINRKEKKLPYIVSFPTKEHFKEPSHLWLIQQSAEELVAWADTMLWKKIVLPRPGTGLGGLKWEDVKAVISSILDDRFFVITPENSK